MRDAVGSPSEALWLTSLAHFPGLHVQVRGLQQRAHAAYPVLAGLTQNGSAPAAFPPDVEAEANQRFQSVRPEQQAQLLACLCLPALDTLTATASTDRPTPSDPLCLQQASIAVQSAVRLRRPGAPQTGGCACPPLRGRLLCTASAEQVFCAHAFIGQGSPACLLAMLAPLKALSQTGQLLRWPSRSADARARRPSPGRRAQTACWRCWPC